MSGRGESLQEKLATASFAWLSVVVKRGDHYSSVKVGWESNSGELLGKVSLSLFRLSSIYAQWLAKRLIDFFLPVGRVTCKN